MLKIFNYTLSININPYLLILFIGIAVTYVIYIYKHTIPQTSKFLRIILIAARSLLLILLMLLIFEPTLTVTDDKENKPLIPVFIDNSSSMFNNDSLVGEQIGNLINEIPTNGNVEYKFFQFGSKVKKVSKDSLSFLDFQEGSTNFENIFAELKKENRNLVSSIIISDGIINDGSGSIYETEKLNIPIYTIGLGDTTKITDVFVNSILSNRFIYKETPTIIAAEISNENLGNEQVNASFFENNKLQESKSIDLNESGINRVTFEYVPKDFGKQKLTIRVSNLNGDSNVENNVRSTYIDVLENKLNIVVVSGTPTADLSTLIRSLNSIDEYKVGKIVQISANKLVNDNDYKKLDSAQVLVLLNFPYENTPNVLTEKIRSKLSRDKTPLLNFIGADIRPLQLNAMGEYLPFTQGKSFEEIFLAQPVFSETDGSLIFNDIKNSVRSNDLPPIAYPNGGFKVKPGAKVIATAKVNNVTTEFPMIIGWNNSLQKSITFIGSNYWKWRINFDDKNSQIYDQIIYNSIQWLRVLDNQRKFYVKTSKDIYAPTEEIEFTGELYNDKLEPIDYGSVILNINSSNKNYSLKLTNDGTGLYNGKISIPAQGDFNYTAVAEVNEKEINRSTGKFNIGEVDLEKMQTVMQDKYLKMLATLSGGKYTYINNSKKMIDDIETSYRNKTEISTSSISYDPISMDLFLVMLVLLLTIEWFIRKKEGML